MISKKDNKMEKINQSVEKSPGALEEEPIIMEVDEENQKMIIIDGKKKTD